RRRRDRHRRGQEGDREVRDRRRAGGAVAALSEALVPDIGDFTDVPVVEVLVKPGDEVEPETPLVTLESDKASMDVPAPFGGVGEEVLVEVGDTVSEGTPIVKTAGADGGGGEATEETAAENGKPAAEERPAEVDAPAAPAASGNGAGAAAGPVYAGPGA